MRHSPFNLFPFNNVVLKAGYLGCASLLFVAPLAQAQNTVAPGAEKIATPLTPPSEPVALDEVTAGPAGSPSENQLPEIPSTINYSLAPIRWGGSISANTNTTRSDINQTTSNAQILSLRGASYIYQPWYAQLSGNIDVLNANSSNTIIGADSTDNSNSTAVNYGLNLNLFPVSRFPFQAYVQQSDSRADANTIGTQYTSNRVGVTQNWRPEVGNSQASVAFDHSRIAATDLNSVVDALRTSYTTTSDNHNLDGALNYSKSTGDVGGQNSDLFNLQGNHAWNNRDKGLSMASYMNVLDNKTRYLSGNTLTDINTQLLQLGNNVTWRPNEETPLTINGGVNMITSNTSTDLETASFFNLNAFFNTHYRFSKNLSGSAGFNVINTRSTDKAISAVGENAALTYTGDPILFGKTVYNWGTGIAAANQNTNIGLNSSSASGNIQHGVSRQISSDEKSVVTLNASQGIQMLNSNTTGQDGFNLSGTSMSHSIGAAWFTYDGQGAASSMSATYSDFVSLIGQQSHYRNLYLQGNLQNQLNRRSSFSANVNINGSQQLSSQTADSATPTADQTDATIWSGSASVMYSLRNPFEVNHLTYSITLKNNYNQTNLRVVNGDPNALSWQTGLVFQQALEYRVGRLSLRGSHTISDNNGIRTTSVYGTVVRSFGDY